MYESSQCLAYPQCSYKSLKEQVKSRLVKGQVGWVKGQSFTCVDVSAKAKVSEQPAFGHGTLSSSRTRSIVLLRDRVGRAVSWVGLHPNGCAQWTFIFPGLKTLTPIFSPHPIKPKPNFTHHPVGQPKPAYV